jgi:hypothetical protein
MKIFIRIIALALILVGICSFWEFTDVVMYGESQHSLTDFIAAIFMAWWLDSKIWEDKQCKS